LYEKWKKIEAIVSPSNDLKSKESKEKKEAEEAIILFVLSIIQKQENG
jgi:hypothetical protein